MLVEAASVEGVSMGVVGAEVSLLLLLGLSPRGQEGDMEVL